MRLTQFKKATPKRIGQELFNTVITRLPSVIFNGVKVRLLRLLGAEIGRDFRVGNGVRVLGPSRLTVGDGVSIAHHVVLDARGSLALRDGALVGFESVLLTYTHASEDADSPVHTQGTTAGPVTVGENSWIGARCLLLPGATIGKGSVVGAMSVTSSSFPPYSVLAGVPARVLKRRSTQP